jgi:vesicle coat complex subunit
VVKRRRLFRVTALSLLLLALPLVPWGCYATLGVIRGERFYHGLPTSYWREMVKQGPVSLPTWSPACVRRSFAYFGAGNAFILGDRDYAAIPVTLELLKDEDAEVRQEAFWTLFWFTDSILGWRHNASGEIPSGPPEEGRRILAIVPLLLEALHDEESSVRMLAAQLLGHILRLDIGPEALPLVTQELWCPDHRVRIAVVFIFSGLGEEPSAPATLIAKVVPALVQALHDDDQEVRSKASDALWQLYGESAILGEPDALLDVEDAVNSGAEAVAK